MKSPKPWYWTARKAWYVEVDGKQIRLHENEKEACERFYQVMVGVGKMRNGVDVILVYDAAEALMELLVHRRSSSVTRDEYCYGPFVEKFGTRKLASLSADEIVLFIREYKGTRGKYSDSSRRLLFGRVKYLFKWARDTGLLSSNPLALTPNPWPDSPRIRVMTPAEYQAIVGDQHLSPHYREAVEYLWNTGMRPEDFCRLEARHLHATLPMATLSKDEHKTGRITGKTKEIYFPTDLMERAREYARVWTEGPIFRREDGMPHTRPRLSDWFSKVKKRRGWPDELVLYMARHSFGTRLLENNVPLARAAKLMGHASPATLLKHYYHPDQKAMIEDVNSIGGQREPDGRPIVG